MITSLIRTITRLMKHKQKYYSESKHSLAKAITRISEPGLP